MKRERESENQSQRLPSNIEKATPEYVRDSLASWDEAILKRRASRLGVSEEEARQIEAKPLFMVEIEKRAEAEGRPLSALLEEYADRLWRSTYPGVDCLRPDEVAEYIESAVPAQRQNHVNCCPACATLLAAAVPTEAAARDLVNGFATVQQDPSVETLTIASRGHRRAFEVAAAKRWAGAVGVPVLALIAMYLASLRIDTSATRLTFLQSPLPWAVAFVALICTFGAFEFLRRPLVRSLSVGVAIAALIGSSYFVDFRRSQSSRDLAIRFTRDQLTTLSLDSIQCRELTGEFLDPPRASDLLQFAFTKLSSTHVRYVATAKDLPGRVVADIGDHGGDLKWEDGNKTVHQLRFLTGTVQSMQGVPRVIWSNGQTYDLSQTYSVGLLPSGTEVVAAIDPTTHEIQSMHIVALNRDKAPDSKQGKSD